MTTVEVITSVERRRRWGREEKLRIVAESAQSDRTVSQVARAHGIAPGQLFTWRRQLLAAAIERHEVESGFVPVRITPGAVTAAAASAESHIDIRLASGIVISVGRCVEIEPLRSWAGVLQPEAIVMPGMRGMPGIRGMRGMRDRRQVGIATIAGQARLLTADEVHACRTRAD